MEDLIPAWARGVNPFRGAQINPMGVSGPRRNKPLVGIVQGRVANGGLELALASDVCIAADDASFAFEEIRYGTYPIAGGLFRFIRAAGWSSAMRWFSPGIASTRGRHYECSSSRRCTRVVMPRRSRSNSRAESQPVHPLHCEQRSPTREPGPKRERAQDSLVRFRTCSSSSSLETWRKRYRRCKRGGPRGSRGNDARPACVFRARDGLSEAWACARTIVS